MAKGKILKQFRSNGEKVVIRYPRISDCDDLLENFNSLVEEKWKNGVGKMAKMAKMVSTLVFYFYF